jgi:DNA-binding GntR family transcriptional regulator
MVKIPEKLTLEKRSLSEQVYYRNKKMILNLEIKGGERISEEQIAKLFDISQTPIREALRRLEKYGLLKIMPRQYAEVIKVTPEDRDHIGKIRVLLDTLSVEECIHNATDEDYYRLEEIANNV